MSNIIQAFASITGFLSEWGVQIIVMASLLSGVVVLVLNIFTKSGHKINSTNSMKPFKNVAGLTQLSMLLAISVILQSISPTLPVAGLPGFRIPLSSLPIMVSGFVFGPFAGAAVGALTDILGYIIAHSGLGAWAPGIAISMALSGALPVILFRLFKDKEKNRYVKMLIIIGMVSILQSTLTTLWLSLLYGSVFWALYPWRILFEIVFIPIKTGLIIIVFDVYSPLVNKLAVKHH